MENRYFIKYRIKVIWEDEIEPGVPTPIHVEQGLICAKNYHQALDMLYKWYGENNIESIELLEYTSDMENILVLKEDKCFGDVEAIFDFL